MPNHQTDPQRNSVINDSANIAKLSITDLLAQCTPDRKLKVTESPDPICSPSEKTKLRSFCVDYEASWLSPGAVVEISYSKDRQTSPPFQPLFSASIREGIDSKEIREFGSERHEERIIQKHVAGIIGPEKVVALP